MNSHTRVRMLCEGALMVAAAQILSMIKLWEMPWGGSVVLAMVPMILFAVRWGLGPGLLAGFVFGVLQFVFDGGFALGWQSIIGDYLVAFTALGLAGVMKGKKGGIYIGTVIGCLARFLVHYVVGATVWASYMPDVFLGLPMGNPLGLLLPLQHRLYGPEHRYYAGGVRAAGKAVGEVFPGGRFAQLAMCNVQ